MPRPLHSLLAALLFVLFAPPLSAADPATETAPNGTAKPAEADYTRDVAPLFRKYCVACHNADDREGGLSLESYADAMRGGEHGAAITVGRGDLSRLVRMVNGAARPVMPPEGNEGPQPAELARLTAWINAGAKGPTGEAPDAALLVTPRIATTAPVTRPITSVALSPNGQLLAAARYGEVELRSLSGKPSVTPLAPLRGAVNAVSFSRDGAYLVAAAGEPGLAGEASLWDVAKRKLVRTFSGHRDSLYAARLNPAGNLLATGGYDKMIELWDAATGKHLRTLKGHNGAVFDLAFHPAGTILASASGDRTVKLWDVTTGQRLDTFGQPLEEMYAVAFGAKGERLYAAGADHRIRMWQISSTAAEGTNPLLVSRNAHEGAILRLAVTPDGQGLVSSSEDRQLKLWSTASVSPVTSLPAQPDWAPALAIAPDSRSLVVGRLDGATQRYPLPSVGPDAAAVLELLPEVPPAVWHGKQPTLAELPRVAEQEPNQLPAMATPLAIPGVATGVIEADENAAAAGDRAPGEADVDLFRIQAKRGEQWILATRGEALKSPIDTTVAVLDAAGRPVERMQLRAVRDAELTFRSTNSIDMQFRTTNWEEMDLNQFLYIEGEVVKLFQMPRGPDAGTFFYPNVGKERHTYFDTSPRAHALFSPCYIVQPIAAGAEAPDNGLPVFPLYYENDDDGRRELGRDSRLTFVAPADGDYLVRVSDVRGNGGDDYRYELVVRRPEPGFKAKLSGAGASVPAGSGKEFKVSLERIDNFNGPVEVSITGMPSGFHVTSPVVVEAGHLEAAGMIHASPDAPAPDKEAWQQIKVTARATVAGKDVSQDLGDLGELKLAPRPKVLVYLEPDAESKPAQGKTTDSADQQDLVPREVTLSAGTSITCRLRVERNGFEGRIQFDVANLPHGVIVDNIGLSGVLIREGETERTFYLTAAPWLTESRRLFHATAKVEGNQVSLPMMLHVQPAR